MASTLTQTAMPHMTLPTDLAAHVLAARAHTGPNLAVQGTALSAVGRRVANAADTAAPVTTAAATGSKDAFGARVIDLPGSDPRGAPV